MASVILHFIPASRWFLCPQHVRRSGGGKLPPVQGGAGKGGEGQARRQKGQADGEKEAKFVIYS